uniref:HB7 protein n=1 Tax=Chlamydia pneumoniae TaxID=83558 RepID=A0A0F7WXD3_CHLPN|nr:HB7 protein [Chlamydia pneumoniae]
MYQENLRLLERLLYNSVQKSYADRLFSYEKTKMVHDTPLIPWEEDKEKCAEAEKAFLEQQKILLDYGKSIFWLNENDEINLNDPWSWGLNTVRTRKVFQEVDDSERWNHKVLIQKLEDDYEKLLEESSKESTEANKRLLSDLVDRLEDAKTKFFLKKQEEVETRVKDLRARYGGTVDPKQDTEAKKKVELEASLETFLDSIESELVQCLEDQDIYWKEQDVKDLARTQELEEQDIEAKREEAAEDLRSLNERLKKSKTMLDRAKWHIENAEDSITWWTSQIEMKDMKARLKILKEDITSVLPEIDEIETCLSLEELPLLTTRELLTKSYLKFKICSETLLKMTSVFENNIYVQEYEVQLQNLGFKLQGISQRFGKKQDDFANLEEQVALQKKRLRELTQNFEIQGFNFMKEDFKAAAKDLYIRSTAEQKMNFDVPCMELFRRYHEEVNKPLLELMYNCADSYRDAKKKLCSLRLDEKELLQKEIKKEEFYQKKQQRHADRSRHTTYQKLRIAEELALELKKKI